MGFKFSKIIYKKLFEGCVVSALKNIGFKELTTQNVETTPTAPAFKDGKLDLTTLKLPPGMYEVSVTAIATGLTESKRSETVTFTVK